MSWTKKPNIHPSHGHMYTHTKHLYYSYSSFKCSNFDEDFSDSKIFFSFLFHNFLYYIIVHFLSQFNLKLMKYLLLPLAFESVLFKFINQYLPPISSRNITKGMSVCFLYKYIYMYLSILD